MPAAVIAQSPEIPIVITGRALREAQAERALGVERIDRERIARSPTLVLDQLLKDVPGLELFRRSDARSGHPTSQGVTLRAIGGNASSRALLILDGVPQADPFGGWVNWPAYNAADLEQIRVVRGGGSVGFGPGALAGTIEMSSRADAGLSGGLDAGSRDSLDAQGRAGVRLGSSLVSLSARGGRSDGFVPITEGTRGPADERAPYRFWNARSRLVAPIGGSTELQANFAGFHDWRTRGTDFTANRTNGADASVRLVGRGAWQWSALGYWQWRDLRSSFANVSSGRAVSTRVSLQDAVPSHGVGGSFEIRPPTGNGTELRFGGDVRRTDGESRELYSYAAGAPTRRRRAGGESWTGGLFAEGSTEVGRLLLTGGGRIDRWQVQDGRLFERDIATGATLRDDRFDKRHGWLPTARAGAVLGLGSAISLRSAAYLGWRLPTLNELFRPFRAGLDATAANPELDPERLKGAEIGVDYRRSGVRLGLTGFLNRLDHAVANVTLGQGPGVFPGVGFVAAGGTYRQRQNVGPLKVRGLEASAEWLSGPWSLRGGASLSHARIGGLRPAQTPNFAASLAGGWNDGRRGAEIVVRRVGAQYEDDLNTRRLKGATTFDASFLWPLTRQVQFVARGENLANRLVIAGIGGDGAVERATPRTLWLGLRFNSGENGR